MNYNCIDKYPFQFRYVQIRDELSSTTRRYIETLFSLTINHNQNKKNNKLTNDEIKSELLKVKAAIELLKDNDDYIFLSQKYYELENMVLNQENYIDFLIRLECAAGVYPNEFFLNRAKQIFCTEVYIPIIKGTYKENIINTDEDMVKKIKPIKAGV